MQPSESSFINTSISACNQPSPAVPHSILLMLPVEQETEGGYSFTPVEDKKSWLPLLLRCCCTIAGSNSGSCCSTVFPLF
jgi:hypothetical protein